MEVEQLAGKDGTRITEDMNMEKDNITRCDWCLGSDIYIKYHDEEWGVPVFDDNKQFEFLVLESAQAGLSWITVLKKRENYRRQYEGFDPFKVVNFSEEKISELMGDAGIIRNRKKIEASVNNAEKFLAVRDEFGSFSDYLWSYVGHRPVKNKWKKLSEVPANIRLSDRISKDLKSRGFRFLGSTIIYAHMQAVGIVNDHLVDCFRHGELNTGSVGK